MTRHRPGAFAGRHPEKATLHPAELRRANLDRVLAAALDRAGPVTRAELIDATGLSAPTIGSLTSELIRLELLHDLGTGPSRGGRRPSVMEFNARYGFVLSIDIGPTRTRLAIADLRQERLAHHIINTPVANGPCDQLQEVVREVHELMHRSGVPRDRLLAVAVGVPGIADVKTGKVTLAPNLDGWRNIPVGEVLARALRAPVVVENDVNLAILGEHWCGVARGHDNCAFIFVGTGIGAAMLIDGQLHRGQHFMAGEIAVMCMGPQYIDRDFGTHGCLEALAGLQALAARFPETANGDPATWISKVVDAAQQGDQAARAAVLETAQLIGIAAGNVAAVVDPSVIVLGGALFAQAPPLVEAVGAVIMRIARAPVTVALSALGKEAPLWGGLLVALTAARDRVRQELKQ
ncbi:MAG TPA: ROK family protein [Vicinamibacterales bacterium]|nr:ROK family protein [Vicinamibacterales bacterium]